MLQKTGAKVMDSNPAFGVTQEKSMVVDDATAFVKSLNWATENLTETRDYAIATTHKKGVQEVLDCFEADWCRKPFEPGLSAHMIWCPNDGRERIAHSIDEGDSPIARSGFRTRQFGNSQTELDSLRCTFTAGSSDRTRRVSGLAMGD
jgi:hypothetical protein